MHRILFACSVLFFSLSLVHVAFSQGTPAGQAYGHAVASKPRVDCIASGNGNCTGNSSCTVRGGTCAMGGIDGEDGYHDPNGDDCGCQL